MSYTEYLRRKAAVAPVILNTLKPTDASMLTMKKRMEASNVFFADGGSRGTLIKNTDRNVQNNAAVSSRKTTGRPPDASTYTSYRGGQAIGDDSPYRRGIIVQSNGSACCNVQPSAWSYSSGSDYIRSIKCKDTVSGVIDGPGAPLFVDNTIRLSAGVPEMVASGCCDNQGITAPNHTHSPGLPLVNSQPYAVGKPFFMASPPQPQGPNVSPHKVGGYLGPRTVYIENKHGYVEPTKPTPIASGPQGQDIAHLKINKPNLFNVKPY
jgi:hypothetical protein